MKDLGRMQARVSLLALPLLVLGCAQSETLQGVVRAGNSPIFPSASSTRAPSSAVSWSSERCGYSVLFGGETSADTANVQNAEFSEARKFANDTLGESASCVCYSKDVNLSNSTTFQIDLWAKETADRLNFYKYETSYSDGVKGEKIFDQSSMSKSPFGDVILRARRYLAENCYFSLIATHLADGDQGREALRFIASAKRKQPLQTAAPLPVVSSDVSQRLQSLKTLFDQKLISPAEYETKRKAIIDGL